MKSRKLLVLLFIVQLVLCLSFTVSASEYDVAYTMEGSPSIVGDGERFTVAVSISDNKGFLSSIAEVTYDANAISYIEYSSADSAFGSVTVNDPKSGVIKVTVGNIFDAMSNPNAEIYTATGTVAVLTFEVADGYEGDVVISLDVTKGDVMTPEKTFDYTVNGAEATLTAINWDTHVHTEVADAAVEATCTETGLTEGKHCSVCETVITAQEIIPAKGHTEIAVNGKEATCTEGGLTEGKECSVCGEILVAQEAIPA
ncbi:MAG: hypothetical protein IJY08_02325, partial [Clostridia bacterium]|nr:hypothetical protein [Clostridia bacterium]